jgi:hypothetical protein
MPSDSGGLWANMLGIGPLLNTINDPAFLDQIKQFVAAVVDTQQRAARIESKLDYLIARDRERGNTPRLLAPVPTEQRSPGAGGHTASGGVADNGTGATADGPVRVAGGAR